MADATTTPCFGPDDWWWDEDKDEWRNDDGTASPTEAALLDEIEQLRLNLANARTGRALLDLEHLRHDYADLHWRFTKLAALCEKILNEQWQDIMGGDGTRPTLTLPDSDQTT